MATKFSHLFVCQNLNTNNSLSCKEKHDFIKVLNSTLHGNKGACVSVSFNSKLLLNGLTIYPRCKSSIFNLQSIFPLELVFQGGKVNIFSMGYDSKYKIGLYRFH